jgi:hypothetical protein
MPETHKPFETNLDFIVLDTEHISRFHDLLEDARHDYQPRNFGERHLVEELAICKWRRLRVLMFQRAIYQRQQSDYRPPAIAEGEEPDEFQDLLEEAFDTAMVHTPERYDHALAALSRLETRYQRQFCEALRLLDTLQSRPTRKETQENETEKKENENA